MLPGNNLLPVSTPMTEASFHTPHLINRPFPITNPITTPGM